MPADGAQHLEAGPGVTVLVDPGACRWCVLLEHPVQGVVSTRDGDRLVGGLVAEHPAEGRGGPHAAAGVRAEADDGAGAGLQRGLATCTAAAVQYSTVQFSTIQELETKVLNKGSR